MNDQSQSMKQPPQMMMNTAQVQVPVQPHMMSQSHQLMASAHSQAMNQFAAAQSQQMISGPPHMLTQPPQMMLNRSYKPWQSQDPNPNPNTNKNFSSFYRNNNNWKGKKASSGKDSRKFDNKPLPMGSISGISSVSAGGSSQGYKPPTLNELQSQNRLKARKFYNNKKKFNNNYNRFAPYAPRNTTSYIIRAKKSGGITSLVSPCPVTPAVLPTPIFSPSREVLGDTAKEEWGVDGYGSMKGLIRLRSPDVGHSDEEDEDVGNGGGGSSDSDVEEQVEVERRLDHDLSRFEMIYPTYGGDYNNVLENRVDDQDTHIAQLEEENLTLKEKLFIMERELGDLRRRLQFLERQNLVVEDVNEEVVENGSDNESEGGGSDVKVETLEFASGNNGNVDVMLEDNNGGIPTSKGLRDVCMDEIVAVDDVENEGRVDNEMKDQALRADDVAKEVEVKNDGRGVNEMMGQAPREEIVQDKEKETLGDGTRGCEFLGEKFVEEEKYESKCEEARDDSAALNL